MKLKHWLSWFDGRTIYTRPGPDRVQRKVGVLRVGNPETNYYTRHHAGFLKHVDGRVFKLVELCDVDGNFHED